jgi:glutamyl-tRNA reductase
LEFIVLGLNHRTAPLAIRERLSITRDRLPQALKAMEGYGVPGVILCTCNRSEFYAIEPVGDSNGPGAAADPVGVGDQRIKQFLVDYFGIPLVDVERHLYLHQGSDCVRHLFRVATSLDSMILGEEQIIGQVREAYHAAVEAETARQPLSFLFQRALRVGRQVRRDTGIGTNPLSVSRACAQMVKSELGGLDGLQVLVVGAGEAGELAAHGLSHSGAKEIVVANRTQQHAEDLAEKLSGRAVPFSGLGLAMKDADIVVTCTGSPEYVVHAGMVAEAMAHRPNRSLFLIDIAVPRDIEPAVGDIPNVVLHDIDDMDSFSLANREDKRQQARQAEEAVDLAANGFLEWRRSLEVLPTVVALRDKAEMIRESEFQKTVKKLEGKLSAEELASLEAMTKAMMKKFLHDPTVFLKEQRTGGHLDSVRQIFRLSQASGPQAD